MSLFSDRHAALLERTLKMREDVAEKLFSDFKNKGDDKEGNTGGIVESLIKVASSIDKSIIDVKKTEIANEKNNIDRVNGDNFANFLEELHREDVEAFKRAKENKTTIPQYEPTEMELSEGEVLLGKDAITSSEFKNEHNLG